MIYSKFTKKEMEIRVKISWIACFILGFLIGSLMMTLFKNDGQVVQASIQKSEPTIQVSVKEIQTILPEEIIESMPEEDPLVSLGEYTITAYCACELCTGEWAKNRPNGIVYGALGKELTAGVSVASPLPFGTEVYVEGIGEYIVQDRTAKWVAEKYDSKIIDIYFNDHEAASKFGKQFHEVFIINQEVLK